MERLADLMCIKCKSLNSLRVSKKNYLSCIRCGAVYPFIDGKVPVLFYNPEQALATTYSSYIQFRKEQYEMVSQIDELIQNHQERADVCNRVRLAVLDNLKVIEEIRQKLELYLSSEHVAQTNGKGTLAYSTSFSYLRRDWCRTPEGEAEINTIQNATAEFLKESLSDNDTGIFMGAGMGRIAWELAPLFKMAYAIDNSVTMALSFCALKEQDIHFHEINLKRIFRKDDISIPHTAYKIPEDDLKNRELQYLVTNALQTPFGESTVSSIISVYFTDVFPLSGYLQEIKRILKPGGIFVHFGPLEYHFNDLKEMYSAEEIREIFEMHGFQVLKDEEIRGTNLASSASMLGIKYRNWFFAARYIRSEYELRLTDIFEIRQGIKYEKKGVLGIETNEKIYIQTIQGERLALSEAVLRLIQNMDGRQTIKELMDELGKEYQLGGFLNLKDAEKLLSDLIKKDIIQLKVPIQDFL